MNILHLGFRMIGSIEAFHCSNILRFIHLIKVQFPNSNNFQYNIFFHLKQTCDELKTGP